MIRDNKGRFIKKAQLGTTLTSGQNITINGHQYKIKPYAQEAFDVYKKSNPQADVNSWFSNGGQNYFELYQDPTKPQKTKYYIKDGKYITHDGRILNSNDIILNSNLYELDIKTSEQHNQPSAGLNIFGNEKSKNDNSSSNAFSINKTKLADFLDFAKAGLETSVNNKIAERALAAEKPFLQDVSESHRAIYGDYRAQVQGEQAAAKLRNMASKPMTSDGALQQQMMLDAQIKGQEYIDQGNAKDDAMIKQTREVAWQQEKENQQQRQAVAMQNRQAMLMSEKNKANILNSRDSANYSQVVAPLLGGIEQRLRNEGKEQKAYQDYYDNAIAEQNVWNSYDPGLTDVQKELRNKYLLEGATGVTDLINSDKAKYETEWLGLKQLMGKETLRRQAAIKGATINFESLNTANNPSSFWESGSLFKKGGTIYKARLNKRIKDNDRGAKSIESSKKIAARLLEKAIDALYDYKDVEIIAKPKKKKYQAGGGLPFVSHTPVFATSESGAPTTKTTKKDDKEGLTTKDVLALLKDMDGLPSDMQLIVSSLKNFAIQDSMDPLGLSSSSSIESRYIDLINKVKIAKFNREEYNNAFNQLKGNGGLTELAITSEGALIGMNEGGNFKYFTPEETVKGIHTKEGYQLLTNSNLLHLRANSLDAAFNHKLTTVAQNGIGMETINKLISDAVSGLGSSSNSEEGYTKTKQGELLKGLDDFYKAIQASEGKFDGTVNDLYHYKLLTKTQAEQAKKAIKYVYNTLPSNARALLKVKSDGSESGALKLIETIISSKETNQIQFDLDLVGGKTHKSTSDSSKDTSDLETSLPLNVLKNVGGVDSYLDIDRGDGIHMSVRGTQFNLIKTPNGEPISDTSISSMLQKSGLQSIVKDMRNIQFGDQKLTPEALSFITYNNTGVTRTNLPIKPDGSVNLELLEAYEQAEKAIDLSGDKSPENIKAIYEQYGITSLLNADGTYNQSKFAPFMVTEGYTTDALSGIKESDFVVEYQGNTDAAVALMQKSLTVGTGKNATTPDMDTFSWYNPADWFGWTDKIFKGVLYIPITNNVNTAVFGANQSLDYDEALAQEEKYQNFERMSNQRSTDASLLNI